MGLGIMQKKRLIGIDIIATLFMLQGIFLLAAGLSGAMIFEGYLHGTMRIFFLILGIALIITGIGLRRLKNWGRLLCLSQLGIYVLSICIRVLKNGEWPYLFIIFLAGFLIFYLTRPTVKERFQ